MIASRAPIPMHRLGCSGSLAAVCMLIILLGINGCRPTNLKIEQYPCDRSQLASSAELWGHRLFLRVRKNVEWHLLVQSDFDWYLDPPMTFDELEARFGQPIQTGETRKRPFAKYRLPEGVIEFGLRAEKSGSSVHEAWYLFLQLEHPQHPSQVLEESVYECAMDLIPSARTLRVLDETNRPRLTFLLEDGLVHEWSWWKPALQSQNAAWKKTADDSSGRQLSRPATCGSTSSLVDRILPEPLS
jgi:hypothetical protein